MLVLYNLLLTKKKKRGDTHKFNFRGNEMRISNNSRHNQTKSGMKKSTFKAERGDVEDKIKEDV